MTIHEMQTLNRSTIDYISSLLTPGMSLREVRRLCEQYMLKHGADSFWYWNVGAFLFHGRETALSISGRDYETSDALISEQDILTIDLSPQRNGVWGDYARTIILEHGQVVSRIADIENSEWRHGLETEETLHSAMQSFVSPETTFEELYSYINLLIQELGYVNLDFLGNLGHSIENKPEKRIYIEKGNRIKLREASAFTFEPHISRPHSFCGFKKENIYCFSNGRLEEL